MLHCCDVCEAEKEGKGRKKRDCRSASLPAQQELFLDPQEQRSSFAFHALCKCVVSPPNVVLEDSLHCFLRYLRTKRPYRGWETWQIIFYENINCICNIFGASKKRAYLIYATKKIKNEHVLKLVYLIVSIFFFLNVFCFLKKSKILLLIYSEHQKRSIFILCRKKKNLYVWHLGWCEVLHDGEQFKLSSKASTWSICVLTVIQWWCFTAVASKIKRFVQLNPPKKKTRLCFFLTWMKRNYQICLNKKIK